MKTKRASRVSNYKPGTFDNYHSVKLDIAFDYFCCIQFFHKYEHWMNGSLLHIINEIEKMVTVSLNMK